MEEILNQLNNYWGILVVLLAQFAATIRKGSIIESRVKRLEEHAGDREKHWTTEKKMEVFVPRVELQQKFDNIERILLKLEKKFDK